MGYGPQIPGLFPPFIRCCWGHKSQYETNDKALFTLNVVNIFSQTINMIKHIAYHGYGSQIPGLFPLLFGVVWDIKVNIKPMTKL